MTHTSYRQKHSTRHYMNRRELQSDQPRRFTYHCCVYSAFLSRPPSVHCRHRQAARATPSNHTQGYGTYTAAATVLHCTTTRIRIQRRLVIARTEYESKPFKRRPECEAAQIAGIRCGLMRRAHSVVMTKLVVRAAELASFVGRSSSDLT